MGKGASKAAESAARSQSDVAQQTLDFAKNIYSRYAPGAEQAQTFYSAAAKGSTPELTKLLAPSLNQATNQFNTQRRMALNLAPGGARDLTLRNLSLGEAQTKSGMLSSGVDRALSQLFSGGMAGSQTSLSGYGQAGAGFGGASQNLSSIAAQQASAWGSLGSGMGSLAGLAAGGK